MQIQSIRLKNIKSYGEGPTGTGVTVRFESGVNRVAGRNGHGKTTLIECIGYALFLTKPEFEENFQTETYFLSHGAKEGEIELTFCCEGESFRIERPVGKSTRRRSKVIQLSDQSICAEGDPEVSAFLCRLLQLPEPGHLSEVFAKLVGIKQGRLAWPFDSKPAEAKRYFEPLLEVEVFRDCFDRLKESVEVFHAQKSERREKQATILQCIEDRKDSPVARTNAHQKVESTTAALQAATTDRDAARKLKELLESQARSVESFQVAVQTASDQAVHAKTLRTEGEARLAEATAAGQVLVETLASHQAHVEALAALSELERRREIRDDLKRKRDDAEATRSSRQHKAVAAREQAAVFLDQGKTKQTESDDFAGRIAATTAVLAATESGFKRSAAAADAAQKHRDLVNGWINRLPGLAKAQRRMADTVARLSRELAEWDGARLKAAEDAERQGGEILKAAQDQLARAGQREATLVEQLQQIAGGICPFLKETCRQFDPARVDADLKLQANFTVGLKQDVEYAAKAHQEYTAKLTALRAAAAKIAGKEADLIESLNSYRQESSTWISPEAVASFQALQAWEPQLPGPPPAPMAPMTPFQTLDPASVALLQQQSEFFVESADAWWKQADETIRARLKFHQEEAKARETQETAGRQLGAQRSRLMVETQALARQAASKTEEASQHEQELQRAATLVVQFNDALTPFATLDDDLKREQHRRDSHRADHERYLGARKIADDRQPRLERFRQLQAGEAAALQALQAATTARQKAVQEFDPEKLKAARDQQQAAHDRATTLQAHLESERRVLQQEERRCKEWEQACREREQIAAEIGRCEAAIELTELARKTLRDTAPAIAQHLCNRIATRAQRVFNQISPEPIELAWKAERYSLTIHPGERRFAMLSGGEQTKLALSMTLAMIDELSGLRFCSFDEPTYGVDADSRPRLADAILQAHEAAGLDQLLIVSHDDAFEGRSGHAILLEKSALGTRVALTQ